jgi:hypothetical protein
MIQMALNGEGEPQPTLMQVATQAATIELFTQWQTYRNGVHMDWDTFRSIDFRAIAVAVLTGAGFSITAVEAALKLPTLDDSDLGEPMTDSEVEAYDRMMSRTSAELNSVTLAGTTTRRSPGVTKVTEEWGATVDYPQPGTKAWDEHMRQVQG